MDSEIAPQPQKEIALATAHDIVTAIMDGAIATGLDVPPAWRSIIGRNAKSLLSAGFRPDMIMAACWMAILRRNPGLVQHIAGDLSLAENGLTMTRGQYEQKLALYAAKAKADPLAAHRARLEARWAEIEKLRGGGQ